VSDERGSAVPVAATLPHPALRPAISARSPAFACHATFKGLSRSNFNRFVPRTTSTYGQTAKEIPRGLWGVDRWRGHSNVLAWESGRRTTFKSTCRARGANMLTLEREGAQSHQTGETK